MLALLTGIPGFGKTAHAIDWVFFQDGEFSGLDKYVEGVSGLDIVKCPHFEFPKLSELKSPDFVPLTTVDADDEDSEKYKPWLSSHPDYAQFKTILIEAKHPIELWFLWAQKGSVIVIDESQRFYRPRPSGAKVPLHIAMFEYHRHYGVHFLLISQAPRLMDVHVRSLVEKHVHLDKNWAGGIKYEWSGCRSIDEGRVSPSDVKTSAKSRYKPPVHVFPFYKSSSLHLKVKHKIPMTFWLVIAAIPLFIGIIWFMVHFLRSNGQLSAEKPVIPASGVPHVGNMVGGVDVSTTVVNSAVPLTMTNELNRWVPVVPSHPETAPAYDGLRRVATMPMVSACIGSSSKCKCYTQQGSVINDITVEACRIHLAVGHQFNPYFDTTAQISQGRAVNESPPVQVADSGQQYQPVYTPMNQTLNQQFQPNR